VRDQVQDLCDLGLELAGFRSSGHGRSSRERNSVDRMWPRAAIFKRAGQCRLDCRLRDNTPESNHRAKDQNGFPLSRE
jgi:hypothetical protein